MSDNNDTDKPNTMLEIQERAETTSYVMNNSGTIAANYVAKEETSQLPPEALPSSTAFVHDGVIVLFKVVVDALWNRNLDLFELFVLRQPLAFNHPHIPWAPNSIFILLSALLP